MKKSVLCTLGMYCLFLTINLSVGHLSVGYASAQEILVDAVLASVDGKPITLQDVEHKLFPKRNLSLKEFMNDTEAKLVLEELIMEKVIIHEAEIKKVGVSNAEVEDYIIEVAKRNNLSLEGFEAALQNENKNIEDYKRSLKVDILKSKLTSSYIRGAVSVSEEEIDIYIEANPELSKSGSKIKLSHILVLTTDKTEEQAIAKLVEVQARLQSGDDFAKLAVEFSEGSEAREGGSLGIIAEEDLSPEIFDAIFSVNTGGVSSITKTGAGLHIFKVNDRLVNNSDSDDDDENDESKKLESSLRAEVKKILLTQKTQEKMAGFYTNDIFKSHTIDRKI